MDNFQGYNTAVDAMNVADNEGSQQYWMDFRIIFINQYGAYDYQLINRQDWRKMFNDNRLQVIASRTRNNAYPNGFTDWCYEQ